MASKPVVTQLAREIAGGGGKQKIPLGKGDNRKALGDIGNLVPVQVIDWEAEARVLPSPNEEFLCTITLECTSCCCSREY
ncbi:G2/mitotic-specific cyclin-1-like isoform X2 [Macadamia integrifolia]|uniref:G2/mitotic-specific cyclin-1-like isoform X2 n=1 Tax=Macadamia integrifolia TaxID=60698 RepID=UPI001C50222C|nr:G2/mitotic-specific cyclin-1-like isoform X2 [Macadamia integrifolia]